MDLEAAADELYGLAPEEFVARRTALVAEARAAKDRGLVREIGALRRPTRSAWLVNVLARAEADQVIALLDLAPAFADAQSRGSGTELRALAAQRRTVVDGLARRAVALGAEQGYTAPDGAAQEVAQTLQSALGDPEVSELVRHGRLVQAVTSAGFGALPTEPMLPEPVEGPEPGQPRPKPDELRPEPVEGPDPALGAAAEDAARAAEDAEAALAAGEHEAEAATGRADELAEQLEALRVQVVAAEEAERTAREEARTARRALPGLRQAVAAARGQARQAVEAVEAAAGS